MDSFKKKIHSCMVFDQKNNEKKQKLQFQSTLNDLQFLQYNEQVRMLFLFFVCSIISLSLSPPYFY